MKRKLLSCFLISLGLSISCHAKEIIVRDGDTLSQIASDNNISVRELMDLNGIYNADKLKSGQKLYLPDKTTTNTIKKKHRVQKGETLESIAEMYRLSVNQLANYNGINNINILSEGQILNLTKEVVYGKNLLQRKTLDSHIVIKGETLSSISKKYQITLKEILSINNLDNPNSIKIGDKIYLRNDSKLINQKLEKKAKTVLPIVKENKPPDWRRYGYLRINWASWKNMGGSHVATAINNDGNHLWIAVNCLSTKINTTNSSGQWKKWFTPREKFEFDFLDAICQEN